MYTYIYIYDYICTYIYIYIYIYISLYKRLMLRIFNPLSTWDTHHVFCGSAHFRQVQLRSVCPTRSLVVSSCPTDCVHYPLVAGISWD